MSRQKAEQFEEILEHAAQDESIEGELASLIQVSQRARALAEPPPSPPYRLSPGRQRLLAEAAHLRATTKKREERLPMRGIMKPAIVLMAVVLLFGSVFGVGQAAAASLPGDSLYGLKLATEDARQSLTTDPKASADLNVALAERRMDEVVQLVEKGQTVDDETTNRVEQQLTAALGAAVKLEDKEAAQVLEKLGTSIQQQQQTMEQLKGEQPEAPVRNLIRVMQRVRNDTEVGQGNPDALRQRQGTPPEAEDMPDPADQPGAGPRVQPGEGAGDGSGDGSGNGSGDGSGDGPGPGPQSPENPPAGGANGQGGSGSPPDDSPGAGGPGSGQSGGEGQDGQGGSNGEGQHGRP